MKPLIKPIAIVCAIAISAVAQADIVDTSIEFSAPVNIVGGVNQGGLGTGSSGNVANGDPSLTFGITVDDTADTGAIFEAIFTATGTFGDPTVGEIQTTGAGQIRFADNTGLGTLTQSLTITLDSLTQTSGSAATATFDGFSSVDLDLFSLSNDIFTFNGQTFTGNVDGTGTTALQTLDFASLAPSGSTFELTGTNLFEFDAVGAQFTVVSAVPEPSSLAIVGMAGALLFIRRRK